MRKIEWKLTLDDGKTWEGNLLKIDDAEGFSLSLRKKAINVIQLQVADLLQKKLEIPPPVPENPNAFA